MMKNEIEFEGQYIDENKFSFEFEGQKVDNVFDDEFNKYEYYDEEILGEINAEKDRYYFFLKTN